QVVSRRHPFGHAFKNEHFGAALQVHRCFGVRRQVARRLRGRAEPEAILKPDAPVWPAVGPAGGARRSEPVVAWTGQALTGPLPRQERRGRRLPEEDRRGGRGHGQRWHGALLPSGCSDSGCSDYGGTRRDENAPSTLVVGRGIRWWV